MKLIDAENDQRWDAFVDMHPIGSIYHHSCWMKTIKNTYNYEPYYLAMEDEEGIIQAALPLFHVKSRWTGNRLISVPFSPFCGPLLNHPEYMDNVLNGLEEYVHLLDVDYVQLRFNMNNLPIRRKNYTADYFYKIHLLDLRPEFDVLSSHFHKSCILRPFKKSLKMGLELKVAESIDDIQDFYHLQVKTRKRHGLPPQPLDYFIHMWNYLKHHKFMKILMAVHDSHAVASILLLQYKDMIIYQNGASDKKFLSLKPNHFLLGKAIEMSKREGYRFFNFGKSSPQDVGLIQFKQRWGTEEYNLPYYYYPKRLGHVTNVESSIRYRMMTTLFHHMPLVFLRKIGELTYRHLA